MSFIDHEYHSNDSVKYKRCLHCRVVIDAKDCMEHFLREHSVELGCWDKFIGTREDMIKHLESTNFLAHQEKS